MVSTSRAPSLSVTSFSSLYLHDLSTLKLTKMMTMLKKIEYSVGIAIAVSNSYSISIVEESADTSTPGTD